ncbi:DNA-directed RNA polymerase subunit alpha [Alphaproteobacteria bacterium endosymbiont of Tiliacea citrago]|uniref:DNA-directed RNA polymerase subunit alpha n=1 Tax=Alphaproteobacteria bacterium endosymbiont of Tiliacea citrago TaxID=3077944 RepID=UPI00313E2C21
MLQKTKLESLCSDAKFQTSDDFYREFKYKVTKNMGVTLGNSLRRTLFSQIPGNAIRYVLINGLNHEFSAISGVKESAQELIMNLRKIVFKGGATFARATLNVSRAGEVFASDVKCMSYSIVNENLYLCTLEEEASLKIELYVERGVGIILSNEVSEHEYDSEAIICDSFFNPILTVNFQITSIENNFKEENLSLFVQTNGAVSPDEAMDQAIDIWRQEMSNISERMITAAQDDVPEKQLRILSDTLYYKISEIQGMTTRILNCIKSLNIRYVGELVQFTQKELLEKPNFGENSLNQLVELLGNIGLTLGMDVTGWKAPVEDAEDDMLIR